MSLVKINPLKMGNGEPRIEVTPKAGGPMVTAEGGVVLDITDPRELARVLQIPGCTMVDSMAPVPEVPMTPKRGPGRPRKVL